jgi:iron complex outermembrane receptor protein
MHPRRTGSLGGLVAALLLLAGPLAAQQGTLTGRVTDEESGQPVPTAQVQVVGGAQSTGGLTDASGMFRIQLPAGTYSIVVEEVGHRAARFDGIRVNAGETTTYDVPLTSMALALDGLVVSSSRGQAEKQVDAPATTHIVGTTEIEERPVTNLAEHLREAPGVDIITEGVQSSNVVVRGFNNIFSGSLHLLTDHRLAGVPSLRVNLLHFIPTTNEDVERMEVVLGPGSALYGPNTANGVVHILTKSPLTSQGTTVSIGGGERSVYDGSFRTAFLLGENLGFKLSGQYVQGNEWQYTDPTEAAARQSALANPSGCQAALAIRGFDAATAASSCLRVGLRDFDLHRYGLEARADYRFADDGTAIFTYGRTSTTGIELTGLGAGHVDDWVYAFYQARMTKGRLFAQAYLNTSDAGNSFLLRDGVPLVDRSRLFVAQVQHGLSLGDGTQDFTYGIDYFHTDPRTGGTINGSYENDDQMDELGVYLQSKTALSPKVDLVAAGRMDSHSRLDHDVFSPRAALVFKPTPEQSLRLTYNRAFSTPSSLNFFLDISGGAAPSPLGELGYRIRAFGTGRDGYSFQNADGTLKGMRSPFNPAGASQLIPANTQVMWPLAVGAAAQIAAARGTPLPASLVQLLGSLQPTGSDIGVMVLDPNNTSNITPLSSTTIPGVPGIRESHTETYEVGWQGILQNRVKISADVYYEKKTDFVSPLVLRTPLLTLNGQQIGAFITVPVVTALTQQYAQAGLPLDQAQLRAQQDAATLSPQIATAVASVPVGVVSSPEVAAQGADMIVTYVNVGDIDLWGADLALQAFLTDEWTLNATYSHVSDDYFQIAGADPIALNAPKDKGTIGLAYRNVLAGFNADARVRFTSTFPAESAGYVGTKCIPGAPASVFQEDCVAAATLVDVNLGYKIPNTRATAQLAVTNVFDKGYRSFVGVPTIGRFAILRLKYDLF